MKILICGGRDFTNYSLMESVVDDIIEECNIDFRDVEIVSGHAVGADTLGEMYAVEHMCNLKVFKANWEKYGKKAGYIRNAQMIDYIKDDDSAVVAFMSPNSKGTKHTVSLAHKYHIPTVVVEYQIEEESFDGLNEGISVAVKENNI